ncbi:MAG: hypothetical protein MSH22_06865, partial [Spirochaetia bacterium]|nr:hypothetical protein [Spirochaetia bacterium]
GAVPKVMSVALIELVEMTATLNVVVSINSTTVMQTYWTAPIFFHAEEVYEWLKQALKRFFILLLLFCLVYYYI